MRERDAIDRSHTPATVASLRADLARLGVEPGMVLTVHASLSRLGFVAGGAQAVVEALLAAVGPSGTLMMPTHSGHLSDPASWTDPPEAWWDTIREATPAYDPLLTPTRGMGAIAECFRHVPGVLRSAHPCVSAAAVGPDADALVDHHPLELGLGEGSPQARLYDLDGHVLLLGVTHANNTSLYVSELRAAAPNPRRRRVRLRCARVGGGTGSPTSSSTPPRTTSVAAARRSRRPGRSAAGRSGRGLGT